MAPLTRHDSAGRLNPGTSSSSRSLHPGAGRSSNLPASTSESALGVRTRQGKQLEPPPPPPPAQPKRVRPFILRAKNAPSVKSPQANTDSGRAAEAEGALRKSKTSFELERKTGSPSKPRKSPQPRDENAPPPSLPIQRGLRIGYELELSSATTGPPRRTSRPQSLATSSLRALGKLASSASSAAGAPRRRPLSYVVSPSSPPRPRMNTNPVESPTSSPSRTPRFRPRSSAAALAESPSSSRTSSQTATPVSSRVSSTQTPSHGGLQRRTQASPPHAIKTQSRHAAVEQHKSALKRKTLEERQARCSPATSTPALSRSPAVMSAGALVDQAERGSQPRGGLTRSRRWFGGDPSMQDLSTSDEGTRAVEDRARTGQDAYATPPPSVRGSSAIAARKRASYAALAAANAGADCQASAADNDDDRRTGFASLQELLEQHGYAETRVITPHSTTQTARIRSAMADDVRADLLLAADDDDEVEILASPLAGRAHPPSGSQGPEQRAEMCADVEPKELRERPSLLSLRGLFSFFGTSAVDGEEALASPELPPSPTADASEQPAVSVEEASATPLPHPRMRTTSEMHRWVETVNEVYPPPIFALPTLPGSTATSSAAVMPELLFDHAADDDDDAASSRSYSSSVSFSGSPPTPQPAFGEQDHAFVVSASSSTHLSPPQYDGDVPRNKRLSLRHTVSDSNLLPSYQSFSGLGISAPSPPHASRSQLSETRPKGADETPYRSLSPVDGAAMCAAGTGLWGTSHLRARASQLFSLALARSPIDAATGRSFLANAPSTATAAHPSPPLPTASRSPFLPNSRAPPKLLRKAVSSAGLVSAPQVRRTRVVTKASWESFGSLEAKVSLDEQRRSLAGSSGGESDFDGGIGWGEDLLGRAWA